MILPPFIPYGLRDPFPFLLGIGIPQRLVVRGAVAAFAFCIICVPIQHALGQTRNIVVVQNHPPARRSFLQQKLGLLACDQRHAAVLGRHACSFKMLWSNLRQKSRSPLGASYAPRIAPVQYSGLNFPVPWGATPWPHGALDAPGRIGPVLGRWPFFLSKR